MEKFTSDDLGSIQVKRINKVFSSMSFEAKAHIEKTNRLNEKGEVEEHESRLIDVFGPQSELYEKEYQRLFDLFNGKVNKANIAQFMKEASKSLETIKANVRIVDKRRTKEELEERNREYRARMEEQRKKQEEFDRQSIKIPEGKMGIVLDLCFDDSDMMTDYFCPNYNLESRLLAIVKKQPEKEALARRIADQIPELKGISWTWHTEKYSMGHGNYLKAAGSQEIRKHKAYDDREEVHCFYEVTFSSYSSYIPHKSYLGDLTELKPYSNSSENGKIVRENREKDGVEIIFNSKPNDEILTTLKANGWRWSRFNKLWYNRLTPENLNFANNL